MTQKRKYARVEFETEITIEFGGQRLAGTTINLSQGGALLQTNAPLEFGQKLSLFINLPKIKETCVIPSVVRWSKDASVGVQFEALRAIEVWGINQLISAHK
ncbi:MAG: PilZ domain-containing protein [Deltaproteobacteria bacterium]|nr:PilZ domain-containing protein [Deltaproteobacteria bacterium]